MRGLSVPSSVSGLVTTMEVRGVTKLYCRDMSKALDVALPFSSVEPILLQQGKETQHNSDHIQKITMEAINGYYSIYHRLAVDR